jgi:hypothetical protein
MREGISIEVNATDRDRFAAVVADRNRPQKHAWRARIILACQTARNRDPVLECAPRDGQVKV